MAKDANISLRVPKELDDQLIECANRLDLSKNDIARHAIRAAVAAIEANGYRIQMPLRMQIADSPTRAILEKIEAPSRTDSTAEHRLRRVGGAEPMPSNRLNEDPPKRSVKPAVKKAG